MTTPSSTSAVSSGGPASAGEARSHETVSAPPAFHGQSAAGSLSTASPTVSSTEPAPASAVVHAAAVTSLMLPWQIKDAPPSRI